MTEDRMRTGDAVAETTGTVARLSAGWSEYHRIGCERAPRRGSPGTRHTIRGPWRYLAAHWRPCPHCRPPGARDSGA